MEEVKFEIVRHFGIISTSKGNWNKELNLVSWNARDPKLDVREWAPDHKKMSRGITLTREEASKLAELLAKVPVIKSA